MTLLHPSELESRKVLVLGLGTFGGGVGAARHLAKLGARVVATDLRTAEELGAAAAALTDFGVNLRLGGHDAAMFERAEVVVVNPAIPPTSPWLAQARKSGCRLTTEVSLALAALDATPSLAVTGTHGKSTCAALAAHLVSGLHGKTVLSGNLGGSLLEATAGLGRDDLLVVELSSFQLERLETPPSWPRVAILTIQGEDHLDWHGDPDAYARAKLRLLEGQEPNQLALAAADCPGAERWSQAAPGRSEQPGPGFLSSLGIEALPPSLVPAFLKPVARLAARGAMELGASEAQVRERIADWPGLPHRMESLAHPDGFLVVDNGVATHPEPTARALEGFADENRRVVLLAGGKEKGLPLDELAAATRGCREIHLHGQGGIRLAGILDAQETSGPQAPKVVVHDGAEQAMCSALAAAGSGEVLLFSPSFSSFDEFVNFAERALLFRELAGFPLEKELPRDTAASSY